MVSEHCERTNWKLYFYHKGLAMKAHVSFLEKGFPILKGAFITKDYKTFKNFFKYGIDPYVKDREFCVELLNGNNLYAPPIATYYYTKIDGRYCYFHMLKVSGWLYFKYALCNNHIQKIDTYSLLLPQQNTVDFFKEYFFNLTTNKFNLCKDFYLVQESLENIFDSLLEVYENSGDSSKTLLVTPGNISLVN